MVILHVVLKDVGTAFLWPSDETSSFMLILYVCCYRGRYHVLPVGFVTLCFHCHCWSFAWWLVKSWVLYFLLHSEASSMNEVVAVTFCILHWCFAVVASSTNGVLVVTWRTLLLLWPNLHQWMMFWLLLCVCRTFVSVLQLKLHQWLTFGCCFVTWRTDLLLWLKLHLAVNEVLSV